VQKKIKTAIFPVGGLGTRFLPATKAMPKEMLPVVDKPIIQYAFEWAREIGIERFIFITGRNKNIINNHFDQAFELQKTLSETQKNELLDSVVNWLPNAGSIAFVRQQQPLGLGHAVLCAKNFINEGEDFLVMLSDEMFLSKQNFLLALKKAYEKHSCSVVAIQKIDLAYSVNYGMVKVENTLQNGVHKLSGLVEKPLAKNSPSQLSICGHYILPFEIFSHLEKVKPGKNGEVQLTDAINSIAQSKTVLGVEIEGKRFDCGSKIGFLKANLAFALEREDLKDELKKEIKQLCNF
jgi:UTP--glucose-1-phosphate uridylyltransferase